MRKFGLASLRYHLAVFVKQPALATFRAGQYYSLSAHLSFGFTGRTLVEQSFKMVGAEFFRYTYLVLSLPRKAVEIKLAAYKRIYLVGRKGGRLFGREQILHLCAGLDLALLKTVIKWVARKCAARYYSNHGYS